MADGGNLDKFFLLNWALPANVVPSIESSESVDVEDPGGERPLSFESLDSF
jgi:hypothetical protein